MSNIKIYNCDCMEMLKNTPDSSIDLIITDPPYDVCCTGGVEIKDTRFLLWVQI